MFLLDTDVLSHLRKPRPHPGCLAWLDAHRSASFATSVVTIAEIERGAALIGRRDKLRETEIISWLARVLAAADISIVSLTMGAGRLWGRMTAAPALWNLAGAGRPRVGECPSFGGDLMVAACAIDSSRAVVSGNVDHMLEIHRHFPLPGLIDPFSGIEHVRFDAGLAEAHNPGMPIPSR